MELKYKKCLLIKKYYFSLFFFPVLFLGAGCVSTTHIKDLTTENEEIKTIKLDLQHKEKTISNLLDRLSMKDQEIGKLTDELHADQETIEELKNAIEKLREVDVQIEEKKTEFANQIEETIITSSPETTPGADSKSTERQKTE
jgi:septal ring factor EnvC (AmiA/AmiB activator)